MLEQFGDRDILFLQIGGIVRDVVARRSMAVVQSGHQDRARRRAHRRSRVGLREAKPFLRESIDIGRFDQRLAVTTEISVPEIVSDHQNDIWAIPLATIHRK